MDFPQLKVIKLEQNYRSTSAILRAANNVIGPNPKLFPKTLFSELGEGEPVRVVDCRQRGARGRARGGAHPEPARRRHAAGRGAAQGVARLRRAVPRQPHGQALREGAAQGARFPTRCRAARAFSTAPRSRTCAPGCACGSTTTTTRPSCAPSPRPSAASATPRCEALGKFAEQVQAEPVRGAVLAPRWARRCRRAPWAACTSSAAT